MSCKELLWAKGVIFQVTCICEQLANISSCILLRKCVSSCTNHWLNSGFNCHKCFAPWFCISFTYQTCSGNTSFLFAFTLSQTPQWIFQKYFTCTDIDRSHILTVLGNCLRKVAGHLLETRTNHFNKQLLINRRTGPVWCKDDSVVERSGILTEKELLRNRISDCRKGAWSNCWGLQFWTWKR